ncbi:uncharacterized protein RSE6_06374 [Rhynchosporium secalis]|uniref:Uncharacterized protein n=1 Tax=Rhynchosporium secalis TaxID=38038 RepID=A0A1E1MA66_RHYSE|nr:uncharacterized protein RSE6_06374 [Rhynchosporium secalis]
MSALKAGQTALVKRVICISFSWDHRYFSLQDIPRGQCQIIPSVKSRNPTKKFEKKFESKFTMSDWVIAAHVYGQDSLTHANFVWEGGVLSERDICKYFWEFLSQRKDLRMHGISLGSFPEQQASTGIYVSPKPQSICEASEWDKLKPIVLVINAPRKRRSLNQLLSMEEGASSSAPNTLKPSNPRMICDEHTTIVRPRATLDWVNKENKPLQVSDLTEPIWRVYIDFTVSSLMKHSSQALGLQIAAHEKSLHPSKRTRKRSRDRGPKEMRRIPPLSSVAVTYVLVNS